MVKQADKELTLKLLENSDLYEEEISLVDMTSLRYVKQVTFQSSHYSFGFAESETRAYLKNFYRGVIDALYEGHTSLEGIYGVTFGQMSKEAFQQFYADMYGAANYNALIETLAGNAFNYDKYFEIGTYSIQGSNLKCSITGEIETESLGFKIKGDTLTLTYANGVDVYTRK